MWGANVCYNGHCSRLDIGGMATYWLYVAFLMLWWFVEVYSLKLAKHLRDVLKFGELPTTRVYTYGTVPVTSTGTAPIATSTTGH